MFVLLNVNTNVHHYMFSHVNVHVIIFLTYVLFMLMLVLWNFIYIICYLLTCFVYWKSQEIVKRESSIRVRLVVSFRVLVRINLCSCLCFLHPCLDVSYLFLFRQTYNY